MENILNIFYNEIIKEASNGKVDCGFIYNTLFNTNIQNSIYYNSKIDNTNLFIPTLYIKDKSKFDKVFLDYISKARDFYKNDYDNLYDNEKDYIKAIMTLLWSNATVDDFNNPIKYIHDRNKFFENNFNNKNLIIENSSLGLIEIKINKQHIYDETPYCISISIDGNKLPNVSYGINDNIAYIYAIQNNKNNIIDKKFKRKTYKVNEGLDEIYNQLDNFNKPENLAGVSSNALIALTISIALINKLDIQHIIAPAILPIRWNAKKLANDKQINKIIKEKNIDSNQIKSIIKELENKQLQIQMNISDKFIRNFRRIDYHFKNVSIISFPFDSDSNIHLKVNNNLVCNNQLLYELYNIVNNHDINILKK